MARYHLNARGEPALCRASVRPCPIGGAHYDSPASARSAYETSMGSGLPENKSGTFTPRVPDRLVPPTAWTRIIDRPGDYPAYLADALREAEASDPTSLVDYEEYQEKDWAGESTHGLGERVNLYAGHWVEGKVGVLDGEVTSWFMHGNCAALAMELAPLKTGKVVVFELETPQLSGERWAHVAAVTSDDACMDVEGEKDVSAVAASYNASPVIYDLSSAKEAEAFYKLVSKGKDKQSAFDAYFSPLEQAMIRHYAETVFHSY